jgi:hypothetical protein
VARYDAAGVNGLQRAGAGHIAHARVVSKTPRHFSP